MKNLRQKIVAMAAVVAVSGLMMASVAGAANKLIVNNASNAPVFTVDDAGVAVAMSKIGIGTATPASTLTIYDAYGVAGRGIGAYQVSADGFAAQIDFRKAKGAPVAGQATVAVGDYIGAFHAKGWDGNAWRTGATINYFVDNTPGVGNGGVPIALLFSTGSNDDGLALPKTPRMRIGSDGKISIGNGNTAAVISGTGVMDIGGDTIRLRTPRTPATSTGACNQGEISWDANFVYICVSTNLWKRTPALASW